MADSEQPDERPSLEMPSILRRRRRSAPAAEPAAPEPVRAHPARRVPGLAAALLTGVVVGGLGVLLTWLAGVGCSAGRGTSSCGGAVGLPVLLGTAVLLTWVGSLLLRTFAVADPGATSLLAVAVLTVLVLVLLLGSLDEWWSALAAPVLAALAYAGAWWLTTSTAGRGEEPGARAYDVP